MFETWVAQMMRWQHEALTVGAEVPLPHSGPRLSMWLGSMMNETTHFRTWAKRHRAASPEDADTWEEVAVAPTLAEGDQRDARAVTLITYALEDYAGKQSGGAEVGLGISEGVMYTLQANGHQHAIAQVTAPTGGGSSHQMITASALTASAGHHGHSSPRGDGSDNLISSSLGDSPARTSAWPVDGPVFPASVAVSGLSSIESLASFGPGGSSSRMFPGFSPRIRDATSPSSSTAWTNSGTASHGELWTLDISESPNGAVECSLSEVLETSPPPPRYWLSAKAAAGILRRAERRGKELPPALARALAMLVQAETMPT